VPLISVVYVDPPTGTHGYLVIDRLEDGLAAGGLRVLPGTTMEEVARLAENMSRKQAIAGIHVGGAKAGLDMDPAAPYRREVLGRFIQTMKPWILHHWNVGPDMNTTLPELEALASQVGIPSLKIAIGRNRGLSDEEFLRRYALFESQIAELGTVNQLRAPSAVAAATHFLLDAAALAGPCRVAIQGAGNMGGGTAALLHARGIQVVAWADDEKCLTDPAGLDVPSLLASRQGGRLPREHLVCGEPSAVLHAPCDVLVLAAISHAFDETWIPRLACRAGIVEAANLALDPRVEAALGSAGIAVVPDVIASAGGSLASEALYASGPMGGPIDGAAILAHVDRRVRDLCEAVFAAARERGVSPRTAAYARVGWVEDA
jgi:glutamate dehydrogenase (NAD(P)+)